MEEKKNSRLEKKENNDIVFEALLKQAVKNKIKAEIASLPSEEELRKKYKPSPELEARVNALFAREERNAFLRRVFKYTRRIAAVLVIVTTTLFGWLMLNGEVRATVTRTMVEWFEGFTRYEPRGTNVAPDHREPGYIPDGFWEEYRQEPSNMLIIQYINEAGSAIMFESRVISGWLFADDETAAFEVRRINGVDYHIFNAKGPEDDNAIKWEIGGQRYRLLSSMPERVAVEDLQKMAESVGY